MFNSARILCLFDTFVDNRPAVGFDPYLVLDADDQESPSLFVASLYGNGIRPHSSNEQPPPYCLEQSRHGFTHRRRARSAMINLMKKCHATAVLACGSDARIIGLDAAVRVGISARIAVIHDMGFGLTLPDLIALQEINRQTEHFVVTSYAGAQRLAHQEHVDRQAIEIIPNGVDCSSFPTRTPDTIAEAKHAMGLSAEQAVILMATESEGKPDLHTFLNAAAQLAMTSPHARFVWIHHGHERALAIWHNLVSELKLDHRVIEITDRQTLPLWLAAADIGVLSGYGDSCSPTLLTYMAAGLPIIAANAGGNAELIQHAETGYLATIGESDQLAMYMTVLLLSRELSERFGQAAQRRARMEFTAERTRRRWADFLRSSVTSLLKW